MKKFYSIIVLILFFAISLIGQTKIYPPNLRAPENNSGDQNPNIILDWDAVTGQTTNITYELQLSFYADFTDAITFPRTDVTALQMNELLFGMSYYWRVKAYDDEEPSDWSETWTFYVTGSVEITSPNIDKEGEAIVLVKWSPIAGLTNYQLQIDTAFEWKSQADTTGNDVFGTSVLASDNMWFVGENGMIQHYDGSAWTVIDAGVTSMLNGIFMVDATSGYIVGAGGMVLNYNGTNWTTIDVGITNDLNDVFFLDADNGWAVGKDGTVLKYTAGTWTTETTGASGDLNGIFALNASNVWVCGTGKEVLHYNGSEWMSEEVGTKDHNDIWFVDENNGWVVSKGGKIYYYNGAEWIEQTNGTSKDLNSVCFNGMHGYAVGKDGIMLNYLGGWRIVTSESEQLLNSISVNGDAGLTGGAAGSIVVKSGYGFDSPYLRNINVSLDSAEIEINNLLYGEKSYYRMRAMHSMDTTAWGGGRSVVTFAAPELDSPGNGSDDADLISLFGWDEFAGTAEYIFQIDQDENFTNPFTSASDSTSTIYQMRKFGQDFYWRVKAIHAADESEFSDFWSLTTIDNVTLVKPGDGESDVSFCPSYEWETIVGASSYEIWIDSVVDFNSPVTLKEITVEPSYQCSESLERKETYYWKVRALTSIDTSDWSDVWSLTIEGYAGVGDNEFSNELVDIYPNPSDGEINLVINSYASDVYYISIVDMTGKLIYEENIACKTGENIKVIELTETQKGLYMLNVRKQDQVVTKKLFVK